MKLDLMDLNIDELSELLQKLNNPKFRAKQILQWVHKGAEILEMTNIPLELREKLSQVAQTNRVTILQKNVSKIDKTAKYLFSLGDNNVVEGVLMHHDYGNTLCISSQVGCAMGCSFCASTIGGLVRNLTAGEMLGQVIAIEKENQKEVAKNESRFLRNIVIMGSGEPLNNYDNTIKFLKLVNNPSGINISLRNISLSTCGIVSKILPLAKDAPGVTLSISLHAATDQKRAQIMPIAKTTTIAQLICAAKEFIAITGRRIVFEYALIADVNDSEADARELANLLSNMQCIVNLIPVNPIKENDLVPPKTGGATKFLQMLQNNGQEATIRREMGKDINGACGQLRNTYLENI